MFAIFLVGLLGMLGLATDLGMAFAQRRTMQNSADAGALAGARAIARWTATNPLAAYGDVQTLVAANRMNTNPEITECVYINYAGSSQGACSVSVPALATGVRVGVRETHQTFFIRVVPGAPQTVTVTATATAHVQRLGSAAGDGPFIICGYDTKLASGGKLSILLNNSTFNPVAFGRTFEIHGPQIEDCGLSNSSFKGLADGQANIGRDLNEYWQDLNGTKAGPTRVRVNGIEGCAAGTPSPYNCVMILPIATENPAPVNSNPRQFYIVQIAAFWVRESASNRHEGTLMEDYIVSGPGDDTWCRDCPGIAVIHLSG